MSCPGTRRFVARLALGGALAVLVAGPGAAHAAGGPVDEAQPAKATQPAAQIGNHRDDDGGLSRGQIASAAGLGAFYAAFSTWVYFAWYYDVDALPEFTVGGDGFFGKNTYAGGNDKLGHFWTNYTITRGTTELLEAGGWRTLPASLIASGLSWSFFLFVEVKDGFYYSMSPGDTIANTLGCALGVLMENAPAIDRVFDFRLQYFPSREYRYTFTHDNDLDVAEDYTGQTYMAAVHLGALPGITEPRWMRWAKYLDVVGGFESRNYRPVPRDGVRRRQSVFIGLSLNLNQFLDSVFGSEHRTWPLKLAHGAFEVYSPPYTVVRLGQSTRHAKQPAHPKDL